MTTVEELLAEYMAVVRHNQTEDAVGSVNLDDAEEIMWEIIETYENANGSLTDSDPIWPIARMAAQFAITICQNIHHGKYEP